MAEKYILLIEDNPDDVVLTEVAFQKCRVPNKLVVVQDGEESLDFLFGQGKYAGRNTADLPAVILLDLKLPMISGGEVLRQIRLNIKTARLPVVILSSSVNRQEIEECELLGINRYFRKPDNFEQFKKIVEEIRTYWLKDE